jgi:hypothetical protein
MLGDRVFEEGDVNRVEVIGHMEVLAQTLHNQVNNVDDADLSRPFCRMNFSCSTGNSINNSAATIQQHTMHAKALRDLRTRECPPGNSGSNGVNFCTEWTSTETAVYNPNPNQLCFAGVTQ